MFKTMRTDRSALPENSVTQTLRIAKSSDTEARGFHAESPGDFCAVDVNVLSDTREDLQAESERSDDPIPRTT